MPHIPDHTHAGHDPALVAAHAAGDATGPDLAAAIALVAGCPACAELHRDLRAIAAALPELPAPARPRDFRLTPEQAAGLRPGGWRGVLAALAGPRFSFAVPLGTGLATLGLAAILFGSLAGLPLGAGGAATSASRDEALPSLEYGAPLPAAAPSAAPASGGPAMGALPAPTPASEAVEGAPSAGTDLQAGGEAARLDADAATATDGFPAGVVIGLGGVLALVAGIVLLGLRWGARRAA